MEHTPVLLKQSVEGLRIKPGGVYVDGTLGRGGHAREIAKRLDSGRLIAIDRDDAAIVEARGMLSGYEDKITFIHGNFGDISDILDAEGIGNADGMLFDFGVSSPQLDNTGRGFSYMHDAPLDMRMDRREETTALDIVNDWTEDRLRNILYRYGEERYAANIARAIVKKREITKIRTTFDLNDIIFHAIPAVAKREARHPSKRTFQALRIAVNDELGFISKMLDTAPDRLAPSGRLCVICFHKLETKLVKNTFASRERGCICPKDFPVCVCGVTPTLRVITRKPITPQSDERQNNPRARSGSLRIAERI